MANNTPPRWGFMIGHSDRIYVHTHSEWVVYRRAEALMGGWQWERHLSAFEPTFLAPEGTPIPDPSTWAETHARTHSRITYAGAQIVAEEVNR